MGLYEGEGERLQDLRRLQSQNKIIVKTGTYVKDFVYGGFGKAKKR